MNILYNITHIFTYTYIKNIQIILLKLLYQKPISYLIQTWFFYQKPISYLIQTWFCYMIMHEQLNQSEFHSLQQEGQLYYLWLSGLFFTKSRSTTVKPGQSLSKLLLFDIFMKFCLYLVWYSPHVCDIYIYIYKSHLM